MPAEALVVIRLFGTPEFDTALAEHLVTIPGLKAQYAAARALNRIPITLPDGQVFTLSPGGQNVLIGQIVGDFCGYFTPGAHALRRRRRHQVAMFDVGNLTALGVTVDSHGKMPDLVVYLPDRNWLVLIEAASSHGPVPAQSTTRYPAVIDRHLPQHTQRVLDRRGLGSAGSKLLHPGSDV